MVFPWGSVAAARWTLTANDVMFKAPKISGNEEKIMSLEGTALASSALDDELVGKFD